MKVISPNLEKLKEIREAKDVSISEMAEALETSYNNYYHREIGHINIRLSEAKQMAEVLDTTIEELFYEG